MKPLKKNSRISLICVCATFLLLVSSSSVIAQLGVHMSLPTMDIVSATCTNADGETQGSIHILIRNTGESGCGQISMRANPPFNPLGAQQICLDSGDETTVSILYSAGTASTICKDIVVSLQTPADYEPKTTTVSCCASPIHTCDNGRVKCDGAYGYRCTDFNWGPRVLDCSSQGKTCAVESNNLVCRDKPSDNTLIPNLITLGIWIVLVLAILCGLILFIRLVKRPIQKSEGRKADADKGSSESSMYCSKCGKNISKDDIFCKYCGNRL
jgi:hypothetical protein